MKILMLLVIFCLPACAKVERLYPNVPHKGVDCLFFDASGHQTAAVHRKNFMMNAEYIGTSFFAGAPSTFARMICTAKLDLSNVYVNNGQVLFVMYGYTAYTQLYLNGNEVGATTPSTVSNAGGVFIDPAGKYIVTVIYVPGVNYNAFDLQYGINGMPVTDIPTNRLR